MTLSTSVVIPTLNAEHEIGSLLRSLAEQTVTPSEILVIDSSSDDDTGGMVRCIADSSPGPRIRFVSIKRSEFNHGGTRRRAVSQTDGDVILVVTQDAVPADNRLIENLLRPFADPSVAIASGRQVAKPDAMRAEQLVREFNYPAESHVYSAEDLSTRGLKTYFTSDVCCAYRRTAYEAVGGFPQACNTSEDMYVAIRAVKAGWKIAYAADACVLHSHNLTPAEQYWRNWQVGYFLESQAVELAGVSEVGEGTKLAKYVAGKLTAEGKFLQVVSFGVDCAARLLGNRAGRRHYRSEHAGSTSNSVKRGWGGSE